VQAAKRSGIVTAHETPEQRDRDRDLELALAQVLAEDRVEVMLDRGLARDIRAHAAALG
jgi:hypothetical protein